MPRSSRHKSHKVSKHSSKDTKEHSESEKEDVKKMKDRNNGEGSVRVSKDLGSSEKRKISKDASARDNGSTAEEYVGSKRRKEKADDRWNGGGDEEEGGAKAVIKEVKGEISRIDGDKSKPLADSKRIDGEKSTPLADSKSRSSRRHESAIDKKDDNVGLLAQKEESKSTTSRVDSKRKSEKDSVPKEVQQNKDSKDKERGLERERKIIQDIKREKEATVDVEAARKQGEDRQGKRGKENTEHPIEDELRNPELEKELERRMRKRGDGSTEKDKYHVAAKESEDGRLSSRGERAKDGRYKDEKHKDGSSGDKHREDSDRGSRHKDDKYREDAERDGRRRDVKYREDGEKDYRHKDNKYREDGERENKRKEDKYRDDGDRDRRQRDDKYCEDGDRDKRQRDDKYREDGDRDQRRRDDKYREDGDVDIRYRDEKYREDGDRDNRHRSDKYDEDGDRDYRHRGDKYHEHGERDDRRRDDRYVEDGQVDGKNREEKNWEDVGRDSRFREGMQREDNDKDKRLRDVKYRDEQSSRDRTSGKSDMKHLRDESSAAAELHHRKSNHRDASPIVDDQSSRYKDDKGRRRTSDKEDRGETRSRSSTKEQINEGEKRSLSSVRVELVGDRGRSNSRNTALDITPRGRRNSPSSSSYAVKDHYRLPKHEESNSRDYIHEERFRRNVTSSKEYAAGVAEKASNSRSIDKTLKKDDIHLVEFSGERHPKEDARASPLHLLDKSPSSTSADRRQLNRSNVRRNLDIEDSGQRSGGSRDAKSPSQVDGDNKSVSSPFSRTGHFSSNPRSFLPPPPPFRMGADSPLVLGSFEDDNRSKSNNRHRRIGDPSLGRSQGSPWRGVPNWPSPVPNGFIPFQHGPPQVGFHPVMQQFSAPPMFNLRPPSMEMNQSGVPYHVTDGDRFSGHGRPLGWRNPVDDPIHGWDASNAVFGDESHVYGRPPWDHNRTVTGGQVWETSSGAMWKGHSSVASTDLPSAPDRGGYSARGQADEVWPGQSSLKAQSNEKHPSAQVESIDIDQSNDFDEKSALETPKTIPEEVPNLVREEDACLSHLYLSMLDISLDLTEPELYSQYTNLVGMDPSTVSEGQDSKFLLVEEAMGSTAELSKRSSSASLFPTFNNSVLQKAMSLYKRTREEVRAIPGDKVPIFNLENLMSAVAPDQEGLWSNDKSADVVPESDQQEALVIASALKEVKKEISPEITADKIDEPVLSEPVQGDGQEKSEAATAILKKVKVELDLVVSEQDEAAVDSIAEENPFPENEEKSSAHSLGNVEEANGASDSKGNCSVTNDVKCDLSLFSDVSIEAVMPESVESESVNLSRIHQSPGSTH